MNIRELSLEPKMINCLRREGIECVDDLITRYKRSGWKHFYRFGKKSRSQLEAKLLEHGITLKKEL